MKKSMLLSVLALALCLAALPAGATTYVTFGTGGTGGTFYAVGAGMAKLMTAYGKDISASAEATGASVANVKLLQAKKVQFGLVATDALYSAYKGLREFKQPLNNLRLVLVGYSAPFHVIVAANSNVNSLKDLKGKRIASYPGNTSEFQVPAILSVYGITRKDYKTIPLRPAEQVQAYKDGAADCLFSTIGAPSGVYLDLATTHKVKFLPIEGEYAKKAVAKYPFFPMDVIKANTYPGQNYDVHTLATKIVVATHKDVPGELVTMFLNIMNDHLKELAQIHKSGGDFKAQNIKDGELIPLHPAAKKFYQQKGILK